MMNDSRLNRFKMGKWYKKYQGGVSMGLTTTKIREDSQEKKLKNILEKSFKEMGTNGREYILEKIKGRYFFGNEEKKMEKKKKKKSTKRIRIFDDDDFEEKFTDDENKENFIKVLSCEKNNKNLIDVRSFGSIKASRDLMVDFRNKSVKKIL